MIHSVGEVKLQAIHSVMLFLLNITPPPTHTHTYTLFVRVFSQSIKISLQ